MNVRLCELCENVLHARVLDLADKQTLCQTFNDSNDNHDHLVNNPPATAATVDRINYTII